MKIKILAPYNKTIEDASAGELLIDVLRRNGISLNARCGGAGTCGRCAVILDGKRVLSCRHKITTPPSPDSSVPEVFIPELSRLEEIYSNLEDLKRMFKPTDERYPFSPVVEKIFVAREDVPEDFSGLWERISSVISSRNAIVEEITISLDILRERIASGFSAVEDKKSDGWSAVLFYDKPHNKSSSRVLSVGKDNRQHLFAAGCYGLAVDLGTTTVAVALVDLKNGEVIDSKVGYNRQITHGEDVITRIIFAENPEGLDILSHLAAETINDVATGLLYRNKINPDDVWAVVIAGNTAMIHILYKIDPAPLRREPFAPVAQFLPTVSPERLGLRINPDAGVIAVPSVSAYVGGDITAGLLATDMLFKSGEKTILVDAGTNGEIVFTDGDFMVCASCSAGPAFEGVGIKSGMHAVSGAIEDVKFENGKLIYKTIGDDVPPKGICGSGLISLLCALLDEGVMNPDGKLDPAHPLVRSYSDSSGDGLEFVVVKKDSSASAPGILSDDITITESDIQNLLRSKGAIYMGIETVLKEMGFTPREVDRIYISGGFGSSLDIRKAIEIGMLPDIPVEVYKFIGNSSLKGAVRILLSSEARLRMSDVARRMTYIDLGTNDYFIKEYTASLFFPHTDIERFPSVKKRQKR